MCTKKNNKLPCLIPQTIIFDKLMPKVWLFNPKNTQVVMKKNSDKLSNLEIAKALLGIKFPKDIKIDTLTQLVEQARQSPQFREETPIAFLQMKRNEGIPMNRQELLQFFVEGKDLSSLAYMQQYIENQNEVYYVEYHYDVDFIPITFKFFKKTLTIKRANKSTTAKSTNPFQTLLMPVQSSGQIPVRQQEVQKVQTMFKYCNSTLNQRFQEVPISFTNSQRRRKRQHSTSKRSSKSKYANSLPNSLLIKENRSILLVSNKSQSKFKKEVLFSSYAAPYQRGLRDEIASNGQFDNFMMACKQFRLDKNANNEFKKYPKQIVEEDKKLSKTLYKHLILERCQGDFCNYKLIEKNKGPLQLRKGLLETYKNVFKESKQTVSNMSTNLPYEISLQLIVRTRDDHKEVIELFKKFKIHLENYNPEEHPEIKDEQQHPFSKENSDVQALINLYKSVKICKNCFIIYSMIQRHFESQLKKDIKNGVQFINEKKTPSLQIDEEAERRRKREENIHKRQEKLLMKPTTSTKSFRIFRAPTQKRNFLITSIPESRVSKTASPEKFRDICKQIEINRLTLGYLNYQKLEQFQKPSQMEQSQEFRNESYNLINLLSEQKAPNVRRIDTNQQENKELQGRAEEIKKMLVKTSKKEQECRAIQKEYYIEKTQEGAQQILLSTSSHYYYHVNFDIVRKLYQFQLSTPMQALSYDLKYDQLRPLQIEEVCEMMNYPSPCFDITQLEYLVVDSQTAVPYALFESNITKKKEKSSQSGIDLIIILHDMFESFFEYYPIIVDLINDAQNKKVLLLNTPGQAYTLFNKKQAYTNIYIAGILDQILYELSIKGKIDLQTDTLKILGVGSGGFHAQAFIVQCQNTIQFSQIAFINSYTSIYPQLRSFFTQSIKIFESQPYDMPELAFEYTNTIMNTQPISEDLLSCVLQQNPINQLGRQIILEGLLQSPSFMERFQKLILSVQVYHSLKNCLVNISEADLLQTFLQDETLDVNNVALSKKIQMNKRTVQYIEGGHSVLYENKDQLRDLYKQFIQMYKFLILLQTLLWISETKKIQKSFRIRQLSDWEYLTKFGAEVGDVTYHIKFKLVGLESEEMRERKFPIQFELYLDEEWPEALEKQECERASSARRKETIQVPGNGEFSQVYTGNIKAKVRAHMWYYAISDCHRRLRDEFKEDQYKRLKLEVDIHIKNAGKTEFSVEQFGIQYFMIVVVLVDIVMLVYNGYYIVQRHEKYEEFSLALFLLVVTLFLETISYGVNLLHLWFYSNDGQGVFFLHVASVIVQVASQFSLTMILVMLSWGWQISFTKFENFEIFLPLSLLIAFFQLTIVGVGFIDYDAYYKDHSYEGWVGWLASFIFIGEFIYFMNGLSNTYKKSNGAVQQFILMLGVYGGIYFISFPVLQTVNLVVARYLRHKVMEIGTISLRTAAILLLTHLFTSKKSLFAKISYDSKSFLDRNKDE
ncbi:unnamed protein product (macronuclear) [Paramecium tetraurelia]|uniref:GPR180/TMEM145 transmembrane domain-containing protein n=1 Tax=Paramecium tetraurelia TaxID=5888 RepID=A0BFM8_PARTE|nr:uncharacterized protein GSPATT00028380001 [Paramecium tetraurelia]CAK57345.1 unnamed protein product [Paramecium tetraurelia]|eukprot:XP_001424743.1 hypothetical protein (macronuclear) [Paramecium tetraurelia strain d4-2]